MVDILFITPNLASSVKHEINGTMLLGTFLLQDGFDVKILRFSEIEGYNEDYPRFIENFVQRILEREPKCVSFYSIWNTYHITLRLCREIKKRNKDITVILGGPHSSLLAEETLLAEPSVDYLCTGEGENTVVPFFRRLLRNEGQQLSEIAGLCYRENGKILHNPDYPLLPDLDGLPQWDDRLMMENYDGLDERVLQPHNYYMPLEVGRGCPYNCTFCCTSFFWHRTYRLKSAKRIVEDIKYFKEKFGYASFLLSHDALTANEPLMREMCDEIIKENLQIQWECSSRVDCLTPDLIVKLKESGLRRISMGLETGSERMQKLTNKNLDLAKAVDTVKVLLDNGINTTVFFVFGLPEETEEEFNETLNLIFDLCDIGVHQVRLNSCSFSPKTVITDQYYDDLVFDTDYQVVALNNFGCREEFDMIKEHKALYTSYYHLHTPVRDMYPYAKHFCFFYQAFPETARYIRKLYHGNYLNFYKDFVANNKEMIQKGVPELERMLRTDPLTVMLNTIQHIEDPAAAKVRDLLRFETELKKILVSEKDAMSIDKYAFRYRDYKEKKDLDQFADGGNTLLIRKQNNTITINTLG